ncbi:hypothetical protein FRC08_012576 [Ceratobasidium sp. 394]|nr:hypothetical protein FRC08_012576 [Ceratobasidium sp. 394]
MLSLFILLSFSLPVSMSIPFRATHRVVRIPGLGLVELSVQIEITPQEPSSPAADTDNAPSPPAGSPTTTTRSSSPIPPDAPSERTPPPIARIPSPFQDAPPSVADDHSPGASADNPLVLMTSSQPLLLRPGPDSDDTADNASDSSLTSLDEPTVVSSVSVAPPAPPISPAVRYPHPSPRPTARKPSIPSDIDPVSQPGTSRKRRTMEHASPDGPGAVRRKSPIHLQHEDGERPSRRSKVLRRSANRSSSSPSL